MRTLSLSFGIAAAIVSLAALTPVAAQRTPRHSAHRASEGSLVTPAVQPCRADCGDYSLAVVSALLPIQTADSAANVVTLVVENRGTVSAPASVVSVAPRDHLILARRSSIPSLAPGQRTTIRLPVQIGPFGAQCISITISPAPVPDPGVARFLAAAIADPNVEAGSDAEWAAVKSWDGFSLFGDAADW